LTDPRPGIEVDGLEVVYQRGAEPAVTGLGLQLAAGQGLLVTGRRGSGKTSVLRALLGLVRASGVIEVHGRRPEDPALAAEVGYGPQGRAFPEGVSPRRLLATVVRLRLGRADDGAVETALRDCGLAADRWTSGDLDVEQLRRVSLACAIAGEPRSIMLDDPWEFSETYAAIERCLAAGGVAVVATHDPGGFPTILAQSIELEGGDDPDDEEEDDDIGVVSGGREPADG